MIDKRISKAPKAYAGKRETWRHFKVGLLGYVSAVSPELKQMMAIAETLERAVDMDLLNFTQHQRELNGSLYVILTSTLEAGSKAMDTLCNVEEGNGLEVYRRLARKAVVRTAGHDRGRLLYVMQPQKDTELMALDYWGRLERWETRVTEYERLAQEEVPDKLKAGVSSSILAPKSVQNHLALHAYRLTTSQQVKDEVEAFLQALDGMREDSPMDVGALQSVGAPTWNGQNFAVSYTHLTLPPISSE